MWHPAPHVGVEAVNRCSGLYLLGGKIAHAVRWVFFLAKDIVGLFSRPYGIHGGSANIYPSAGHPEGSDVRPRDRLTPDQYDHALPPSQNRTTPDSAPRRSRLLVLDRCTGAVSHCASATSWTS